MTSFPSSDRRARRSRPVRVHGPSLIGVCLMLGSAALIISALIMLWRTIR